MTMENRRIQIRNSTTDFLVFTMLSDEEGIDVRVYDENVWLTQKSMQNYLMWEFQKSVNI